MSLILDYKNFSPSVNRYSLSSSRDFSLSFIENIDDYEKNGRTWNLCQGKTICPNDEYTVCVMFYSHWGQPSGIYCSSIKLEQEEKSFIEQELSKEEEATKKEEPINKPSCQVPLYPKTPIKYGSKNNNPADVKLLQEFLNTYEKFNLKVDGIYSLQTRDAVIKWQEKYADEVLKPWGLSKGTGYVYTTTLKKIKAIHEAKCVKPEEKAKTDTQPKPNNNNNKYTFTRDLYTGIIGTDVKQLQIFLNTHGFVLTNTGPGSPGNETEKFGALTRQALSRFQAANKISPSAGYFGIITRNKVNGY